MINAHKSNLNLLMLMKMLLSSCRAKNCLHSLSMIAEIGMILIYSQFKLFFFCTSPSYKQRDSSKCSKMAPVNISPLGLFNEFSLDSRSFHISP